jgi:hypothetical protein
MKINLATRPLMRRWYREQNGPQGVQRRRALLDRNRRELASYRRFERVSEIAEQHIVENQALRRRNTELADKLKALHDRIPIYARIKQEERYFGRTFVIPVSFNPDAIIRTLAFDTTERDTSMDMEREFSYLAAFASEKILATLRDAAAEYLGMPGKPR